MAPAIHHHHTAVANWTRATALCRAAGDPGPRCGPVLRCPPVCLARHRLLVAGERKGNARSILFHARLPFTRFRLVAVPMKGATSATRRSGARPVPDSNCTVWRQPLATCQLVGCTLGNSDDAASHEFVTSGRSEPMSRNPSSGLGVLHQRSTSRCVPGTAWSQGLPGRRPSSSLTALAQYPDSHSPPLGRFVLSAGLPRSYRRVRHHHDLPEPRRIADRVIVRVSRRWPSSLGAFPTLVKAMGSMRRLFLLLTAIAQYPDSHSPLVRGTGVTGRGSCPRRGQRLAARAPSWV